MGDLRSFPSIQFVDIKILKNVPGEPKKNLFFIGRKILCMVYTLWNKKKNLPSQSCFILRARKQRNNNINKYNVFNVNLYEKFPYK